MRISRVLSLLFLMFAVMASMMAEAPDWAWANSIAGYNSQSGTGIAMDAAGNSYATGYYSDDTNFGTLTLENDATYDSYVLKLGPAGNWIWVRSAGEDELGNIRSYAIAVDTSGNSYVTGEFSSTVRFGSIILTSTESSPGNFSADIFIAKLDPVGNWLWARKAGGLQGDGGYGIATDTSGNCIVTGIFHGTATFGTNSLVSAGGQEIYVTKLDTDGNWLWAVRAGSPSTDSGSAIATDSAGNIYVTGYFSYPGSFGSIPLNNYGGYDVFIAKLDPSGTWLWAKKGGTADYDYGRGIAVDSSGNCYATGYYANNAAWFGSTRLPLIGQTDVFVVKLDTNGTWLWARNAGGTSQDMGYAIDTDSSGNVYLAGCLTIAGNFGEIALTANLRDVFAAKLDTDGNWLWAQKAGGGNWDYGYGVAANDAGNCSLTGDYANDAYFGSTTLYGNTFSWDAYVAMLDSATGGALPLPPDAVAASVSGDDIFLNWDDVTEDSSGNPITVHHYLVRYYPDDPAGTFSVFGEDGSITISQWTHTGAAALYGLGFYQVIAVTE